MIKSHLFTQLGLFKSFWQVMKQDKKSAQCMLGISGLIYLDLSIIIIIIYLIKSIIRACSSCKIFNFEIIHLTFHNHFVAAKII